MWELTKSCSHQCSCPGTVPELYLWRQCPCPSTVPRVLLGHRQKALFRLVPVPENRERAPSLNGPIDYLAPSATIWAIFCNTTFCTLTAFKFPIFAGSCQERFYLLVTPFTLTLKRRVVVLSVVDVLDF